MLPRAPDHIWGSAGARARRAFPLQELRRLGRACRVALPRLPRLDARGRAVGDGGRMAPCRPPEPVGDGRRGSWTMTGAVTSGAGYREMTAELRGFFYIVSVLVLAVGTVLFVGSTHTAGLLRVVDQVAAHCRRSRRELLGCGRARAARHPAARVGASARRVRTGARVHARHLDRHADSPRPLPPARRRAGFSSQGPAKGPGTYARPLKRSGTRRLKRT
jgi:hypothetical protein